MGRQDAFPLPSPPENVYTGSSQLSGKGQRNSCARIIMADASILYGKTTPSYIGGHVLRHFEGHHTCTLLRHGTEWDPA